MTHQSIKPECMVAQGGSGGNGSRAPGAGEKGGMLDMRFSESVADALARLYSNPVSAVQEIIANSVTACKTAERVYGAEDAHIRVHIRGRNLTIDDRNSLGMPWKVFRDAYARAGRSLKVAGDGGDGGDDLPGLFGCGSLSYVLLSDIMFLETHSRATGEKYAVMACDGRGFQTGLKAPAFDWHGTRVRLTIRRRIDMGDILERIVEISKTCGVRIEVELDEADPECRALGDHLWDAPGYVDDRPAGEDEDEGGNNDNDDDGNNDGIEGMFERVHGVGWHGDADADAFNAPPGYGAPVSGRYVFKPMTFADFVEHVNSKRLGFDASRGTDVVCVRAESPDIEVAAFSICNYYVPEFNARMCLAGMPIGLPRTDHKTEFDDSSGRWNVWVHVKNERRYRPTPDRERFPDLVFAEIADEAAGLLRGRLAKIRPDALPEYLSDPANRALEPVAANHTVNRETSSYRRRFGKANGPFHSPVAGGAFGWLEERHARLARAAGPVVAVHGGDGSSLWEELYADRASGDRSRIARPLLIVGDRLYGGLGERVARHARDAGHEQVVVFAPHARNSMTADDYVGMGCVSIEAYARQHGLLRKDVDELRAVDDAEPKRRQRRPRPPASDGAERTYVVHYGGTGDAIDGTTVPMLRTSRIPADGEPHRTVVRCLDSEAFTALRNALAALGCKTTCATKEKSAAASGVVEFGDFADAAGAAEYQTSMGPMTGDALAGCGRRAVLCEYGRPAGLIKGLAGLLAERLGGDDSVVYVLGTTADLAGCAASLWRSGARYSVWMPPFYNSRLCRRNYLAGKRYLEGVVETERGPTAAASEWTDGVWSFGRVRPTENNGYGRTAVLQMLHSHLVGAALLKEGGLDYGGKTSDNDSDSDDDNDSDDDSDVDDQALEGDA